MLWGERRANLARVDGDLQSLSTAMEMYNFDNGAYPNHMPLGGSNDLGK
ncbi:MAG: hypothetical protein ABIH23_11030 [bacterium]